MSVVVLLVLLFVVLPIVGSVVVSVLGLLFGGLSALFGKGDIGHLD